jgi:transposase InsO family protein
LCVIEVSRNTYFETDTNGIIRQKKLYLDPFMDLYNNEILSYRVSERPNAVAVMDGLEEVFKSLKIAHFEEHSIQIKVGHIK